MEFHQDTREQQARLYDVLLLMTTLSQNLI